MASTTEILARLAQWAHAIEAHDWRTDGLAALGDALAAKDRAIEDLIEIGYVGPQTPPAWMAICDRAHAARG
jgi:hypothetical protein